MQFRSRLAIYSNPEPPDMLSVMVIPLVGLEALKYGPNQRDTFERSRVYGSFTKCPVIFESSHGVLVSGVGAAKVLAVPITSFL